MPLVLHKKRHGRDDALRCWVVFGVFFWLFKGVGQWWGLYVCVCGFVCRLFLLLGGLVVCVYDEMGGRSSRPVEVVWLYWEPQK